MSAGGFWIYLKIRATLVSTTSRSKCQWPTALVARTAGQLVEKISSAFGVMPSTVGELVVETSGFCGHPDFLKRLLQIDHDLTAVGECQGDHIAGSLAVKIGISVIIDSVARCLDRCDRLLGQVLVLKVRHYNPSMVVQNRILGASTRILLRQVSTNLTWLMVGGGLTLAGCGQKGPLFLPPAPTMVQKTQMIAPVSATTVESQPSSTLPAAPSAVSASAAIGSVR
jgi:predicted small lipoprotein YifL